MNFTFELQVMRDKLSGQSRGFGFVTFEASCGAEAALAGEELYAVVRWLSPLRRDTHDHSCYCARSDAYRRLMPDSPGARLARGKDLSAQLCVQLRIRLSI